MDFHNTYEDTTRAAAYDELGFGGTYHLIFRELPALLKTHVRGKRAVDFGCGTGRTTRFLGGLGFQTAGLDISAEMVGIARDRDPGGDYRVIEDGDFSSLIQSGNDLVLSAFTFDNIPDHERKARLFSGLRKLLRRTGRLVNIVSTPGIQSLPLSGSRHFLSNDQVGKKTLHVFGTKIPWMGLATKKMNKT